MFENQPFNFPSQNHKKIVGFQHLRFISACTAKKNRTSLARPFKQKLKKIYCLIISALMLSVISCTGKYLEAHAARNVHIPPGAELTGQAST